MLKFVIFLMIALLPLYAEEGDGFDDFDTGTDKSESDLVKIDPELLKKLNKEIDTKVEKKLATYITPYNLARKLKVDFPPSEPTRKVADIRVEVEKEVTAAVEEKFPSSTIDEQIEAAVKRYPLYKEGDYVEVKIRPTGRNNVLKGKFGGYDRNKRIVIGGIEVPKVDMTDDWMVYFDSELNKQKRERLVKNKLHYFYQDRKALAAKIKPEIEQKLFSEAGYYLNEGRYTAAAEYIKSNYESQKENFRSLIKKYISKSVYAENGYVQKGSVVGKSDSLEEGASESALQDLDTKMQQALGDVEEKKPLFDSAFYQADF